MDQKTFITALRKVVREELKTVIKQELTEILQEGLKSTISEIAQPKTPIKATMSAAPTKSPVSNKRPQFSENKWADVLNETDLISESSNSLESYTELMNEGMDELRFSSADAQGFGMMRQNAQQIAPTNMEDPETGKIYDVAPEVQRALTRDYSALMKAINNKKGN